MLVRLLVFIAALLAVVVTIVAVREARSDIQLTIAAVGFFSAAILFGIGAVLHRLDKQWNFLLDIDERLNRQD